MDDEALREAWRNQPLPPQEELLATAEAILRTDAAARVKEHRIRVVSWVVLGVLCPLSVWFSAHGVTPLVRAAYALVAVGIAISVTAEWLTLAWTHQARAGAGASRSQLATTAASLARQASLFRSGALWASPIYVGVGLIGLWMFQARSRIGGAGLLLVTGAAWLVSAVGGLAKGRALDAQRLRLQDVLADLDR